MVRFVTNFLLKNLSPPYKGTFFTYLVQISDFFHKDFISASLLYSQTLFCRLAHFLQIFFLHHTIRVILPFWSAFHELFEKNISTPNIDTFLAFGPFIWKILEYLYTLYFLPWRCGYSRIAQTKRQRTKTFGLYRNSRAISLARLFFYSLHKTFCLRFSFRWLLEYRSIHTCPAHFLFFKKLKGSVTPLLGYAL